MARPATSIELEMFAVGLGSSIYLRCRSETDEIRVLADGGVGHGISETLVERKLSTILCDENADRIDLIIGTHYDEDHLRGLVPVVKHGWAIGELWLPPILDDTANLVSDILPPPSKLLGSRFKEDPTYVVRYVSEKIKAIRTCREVESRLGSERQFSRLPETFDATSPESRAGLLEQLRAELRLNDDDDGAEFGECDEHVDDADWNDEVGLHRALRRHFYQEDPSISLRFVYEPMNWPLSGRYLEHLVSRGMAGPALYSIARIRRAKVKDAINALALDDLIQATAGTGIRVRFEHIAKGQPIEFHWDSPDRRFRRGGPLVTNGTRLVLLGPSDLLIKRHATKLPVQDSIGLALVVRDRLKGISPSNQLSYVMKIEHDEQSVLICGDSGFNDFMTKQAVEPAIAAELKHISVLQVAHHGGNAYRFYRVLENVWAGKRGNPPIMLLSHGENDGFRPIPEFGKLVEVVSLKNSPPFIAFTSKPDPLNVQSFRNQIFKATPAAPAASGDVKLEFTAGQWKCVKHAI